MLGVEPARRRMSARRLVALAGLGLTLAACGEPESAPAPALDEAAVIARSAPVAQAFQQQLQAQLSAALQSGGPQAAVTVCQQVAPAIADAQSEASGAQVSRIAARHRNPAAGVPAALQAEYDALAAQPLVDGAPARRVWQSGAGEGAEVHFLSAIPMQEQPCAVCHGTDINPELRAHIATLYPGDMATGFAPGELRGALLISWPAAVFAGD